jgi:hypothetical protein
VLTSEQVRAGRALLRWEQRELAEASGVPLPTIKALEAKPGPIGAYARTVDALLAAFEAAGVQFIPQNGGGPGVRLRERVEEPAKNRRGRPPKSPQQPDDGA